MHSDAIVDDVEQASELFVARILRRFDAKALQHKALKRRSKYFDMTEKNEVFIESDKLKEKQLHCVSALNRGQSEIYEYLLTNTDKICLIQAGPGCGKSFVLKTIAFHHPTANFESIIYKKDLLLGYKYCTRRFTVARFMMSIFNIGFKEYQSLERAMSQSLSTFDYMFCLVKLLSISTLPDFKDSIVFLDEYSVMSKSFLVVILTLFEHYGIGAVICGDRNQLQNIHNSKHALLSSYDLANEFAAKKFNLFTNERCTNNIYNALVHEFAQYGTDDRLSEYTFAMLAALFPQQCINKNNYNNTHLAATHSELSNLTHMFVCTNQYDSSFYTVDVSNIRKTAGQQPPSPDTDTSCMQMTEALLEYNANGGRAVGKFLPYLPLVKGAEYYVGLHSESSVGILEDITDHFLIVRMRTTTHLDSKNVGGGSGTGLPHGIAMTRNTDEETVTYKLDSMRLKIVRANCDKVMFDQHREYLLNNKRGHLYNFPIYPTNFMSMHKCQGCTITANVDLLLSNTTYRGLYVALSRVTNPKQIARVVVRDQISNLATAIANIEELVYTDNVHIETVRNRMNNNYIKYSVSQSNYNCIANLIIKFLELKAGDTRRQTVRLELCEKLNELKTPRYFLTKFGRKDAGTTNGSSSTTTDSFDNNSALYRIVQYRTVFLGLAQIQSTTDQCVWLHEFLKRQPNDVELILNAVKTSSSSSRSKAPLKNYDDDEIDECGFVKIAPKERIIDFDCIKYQFQINRDPTTIVKVCRLQATPAQTDDIQAYIQFMSKTKLRGDVTAHYQQTNCVERINALHYLENDEFTCRVYHLYRRNLADSVITVEWLIDQLNIMLAKKQTEVVVETKQKETQKKNYEATIAGQKALINDLVRSRRAKRKNNRQNDNTTTTTHHKCTLDAIDDAGRFEVKRTKTQDP